MSDEFFDDVTLLLPLDGDDASTIFKDYSNSGKSVSRVGTAQIDTAQAKFGSASLLLDGNSDYLTVPNNAALFDPTGDFTIEAWVRFTSTALCTLFSTRDESAANRGFWVAQDGGELQLVAYNTAAAVSANETSVGAGITTGVWYHVALTSSGGVWKLWLDGSELVSETTVGTQDRGDSVMRFGSMDRAAGQLFLNGHMDDIRVTDGVARYAAAFTPPTEAHPTPDPAYKDTSLMLQFEEQNGSFRTIGKNLDADVATCLGGSVISDGVKKFGNNIFFDDSSVLIVPHKPAFDFGNKSFTIEMWVNRSTADGTDAMIFEKGGQSISLYYSSSNNLDLYLSSTGTTWDITVSRIATNPSRDVWHHVAISRDETSIRGFFNGALVFTVTSSAAIIANTLPISIGGKTSLTNGFRGRIDDVRITTGVARYTAAFDVPVKPFTAEGPVDRFFDDVSLLLHMDGSDGATVFTDSSANALSITRNGNAQIDTAARRFGSGSLLLDGNQDWLNLPVNAALDLGSVDFTLECWFRITSFAPDAFGDVIYGQDDDLAGTRGWAFRVFAAKAEAVFPGIAADVFTFGSSIVVNQWNHIALVRSGSTWEVFLNGVSEGTNTRSITLPNTSVHQALIGATDGSLNDGEFSGYIDDLRLTKGVARYTKNFPAPQGPLPDTGALPAVPETDPYYDNVGLLLHMDGSDGSTTFTDDGPSAATVTAVGNAQIDTDESRFGGASGLFDGTGDYLSVGNASQQVLDITEDHTIEGWVYIDNATANKAILGTRDTGSGGLLMFLTDGTARLRGLYYQAGGASALSGASDSETEANCPLVPLNQWNFISLSRVSNTLYIQVNGGTPVTGTFNATPENRANINIGRQPDNSLFHDGWIDELRITKGIGRYTGGANPPDQPFPDAAPSDGSFSSVSLLLPMNGADASTTFTDESTNGFTPTVVGNTQIDTDRKMFGGASARFDGTGDYLTYAHSTALFDANDDFTIEGWFLSASLTDRNTLWSNATNTNRGPFGNIDTDGKVQCVMYNTVGGVSANAVGTAGDVVEDAWHHIAFVRSGSTITIYVNGREAASTSIVGTVGADTSFYIGRQDRPIGNQFMNGWIDDFRITNGVARYTEEFTPPVQPHPLQATPTGPTIDTQPSAQSVDEGDDATFTVAATASSGTLTYQWYDASDDSVISGETGASYVITTVFADNGSQFYVIVSDDGGSVQSNTVTLTVADLAPTIDTQPSNATVGENTTATFTVAATTSGGALTYQWYDASDDSVLVGETAASFSFTAVLGDSASQYYVIVTDDNGATQSNTVTLTVTDLAPTIDTQPVNTTAVELQDATFSVAATASAGSLSYQWYQVGVGAMAGEVTDTLVVPSVMTGESGQQYYVDVTDPNGTVTSSTVTLTVTNVAPSIDTQPQNASAEIGDMAEFTVSASSSSSGAGALSYQWYDASDDSPLSGQNGASLMVNASANRSFYVIVTDLTGSTQSDTATLTVSLPALTITQNLDAAVSAFQYTNLKLSITVSNPSSYQWFKDDVAIATGKFLNLQVIPDDSGAEIYVVATDDFGQEITSQTATLTVLRSTVDDQTEARDPSTFDASNPTRHRVTDWASTVAMLDGQVKEVEDYVFSNRTFRRKDTLLNPKE